MTTIVANWGEGRACALCGWHLGQFGALEGDLALLAPDGTTVAWQDVPPDELLEVFSTHEPACRNCHVVETFRREHPELIQGGAGRAPWRRVSLEDDPRG